MPNIAPKPRPFQFVFNRKAETWDAMVPTKAWEEDIFNWCCQHFNADEWETGRDYMGQISFRNKDDATFFCLRWVS
ncbi:MAG TPA: hypothetical protein VFM18_18960 [Methanosarcina sp.]|nr:hypothetical protein [Methanosarcina sp.]